MKGWLHWDKPVPGSIQNGCFHSESVEVKYLYADIYKVFYDGKWRTVRRRAKDYDFIMVNKLRVRFEIDWNSLPSKGEE